MAIKIVSSRSKLIPEITLQRFLTDLLVLKSLTASSRVLTILTSLTILSQSSCLLSAFHPFFPRTQRLVSKSPAFSSTCFAFYCNQALQAAMTVVIVFPTFVQLVQLMTWHLSHFPTVNSAWRFPRIKGNLPRILWFISNKKYMDPQTWPQEAHRSVLHKIWPATWLQRGSNLTFS